MFDPIERSNKAIKLLAWPSCYSRTQIQLWYKKLKEGREDVNDNARPGRASSSTTDKNIETVKKMILDHRRITIKEIADDLGISFGSCQAIWRLF